MPMLPTLSYLNFPPIWDTIIANVDNGTRLRLRLVGRDLKAAADRSFCGDELDWRVHRGVMVVKPSWDVVENAMALPFFSPYSPEVSASQLYAVRKARFVQISAPARPWISRLLQAALQPDAHVVLYHDDETSFLGGQELSNTPFQLPPCCSLNVLLDFPCPCHVQALEGPWQHSAEFLRISLFILDDTDLSSLETAKCSVLPPLFTSSVQVLTLELRGDAQSLKQAPRHILFAHDTSHLNLAEVAVRVYVHTECEDEDALAKELEESLAALGFCKDLTSVTVAESDWV